MTGKHTSRVVHLFSLPYHNGRFDVGMGRGPRKLLEEFNLMRTLESAGHQVRMKQIDDPADCGTEIGTVIELDRRLAKAVGQTVEQGGFPIVLSGNCNSCLGTCAGIDQDNLGVVWFDAHADFDTPEDNLSGFFDVMGLSILTGSCWKALRETIPHFRAVGEQNVVLVGVRDLEPYQLAHLKASAIDAVHGERIRREGVEKAIVPVLDRLRRRVSDLYLHIDLDCLDPSEGKANQYAAPGGLKLSELEEAISVIFGLFDVRAAAITAYDPGFDRDGRMGRAALRVVWAVARGVCD